MGSLTIGGVIEAETRSGTLDPNEIPASITDEVRQMTVYHHEWARSSDGHLTCIMLAGTRDRGSIVAHDLDAKRFQTLTFADLSAYRFFESD